MNIKMTKRWFFLKKISHIFACESQFLNHNCFLRNPQLLYNSYWAQILLILPSFPVCFVVSCPSFLSLEPEQETVHVSCVLSSSHFWKNRAWVSLQDNSWEVNEKVQLAFCWKNEHRQDGKTSECLFYLILLPFP